ncbi:lysozyme-like [Wyeomyia smithii]|uniref:lysozyme-like n=1 Tax=Wyeomyia smithii TaxID=174621 RepID=UPI002467B449|nr:lysozyme-like [Wyeomyia smithii]
MNRISKVSVFILMMAVMNSISSTEGKKFTTCSLAKALLDQGFSKEDLVNWVCLVQAESGMNTTKRNHNRNGSTDWGLFQINDRYWCDPQDKNKLSTNECKINCTALLTDNITKAAGCAKKIFKRHGFQAWYGWINKCDGKPLPDLSKCKL